MFGSKRFERFDSAEAAEMNNKKQASRIPKEAPSLEEKCDSGERPEATGSPSVAMSRTKSLIAVNFQGTCN